MVSGPTELIVPGPTELVVPGPTVLVVPGPTELACWPTNYKFAAQTRRIGFKCAQTIQIQIGLQHHENKPKVY